MFNGAGQELLQSHLLRLLDSLCVQMACQIPLNYKQHLKDNGQEEAMDVCEAKLREGLHRLHAAEEEQSAVGYFKNLDKLPKALGTEWPAARLIRFEPYFYKLLIGHEGFSCRHSCFLS